MSFNRDLVLEQVAEHWAWSSWSTVRDWIKEMVQLEPKIMRRVSQAKFGDLGSWVTGGAANINKACGCLVGTTALELVRERNHFELDGDEGFVRTKLRDGESLTDVQNGDLECDLSASQVVHEFVQDMKQDAYDAGLAACALANMLGNKDAVLLIKSEIQKQLRLRSARIRAGQVASAKVKRKRNGRFARVA